MTRRGYKVIVTSGKEKIDVVVKLKRFEIMCNYLLHNFCFGKGENLGRSNDAKRSKKEEPLGKKKKNTPRPQNQDLGQTSKWSNLVAAHLPGARLTILDRLVLL